MAVLLGAPVSTGFVSRCLARLDERLVACGFEDSLKDRLRAAPVLGTGYGAADNRGHAAIDDFALLEGHTGVLVRDDYGGYTKFDADLAGVQQCCAHLLRALAGVHAIDEQAQARAEQAARAMREAGAAVNTARAAGAAGVDPDLLARLRRDYDQGVAAGISTNLSRPWRKGKHPGLVLARRLQKKAGQVWLFTTRLDVPWPSAASRFTRRSAAAGAPWPPCAATATSART